jgi:uncharacterized protein YkwD
MVRSGKLVAAGFLIWVFFLFGGCGTPLSGLLPDTQFDRMAREVLSLTNQERAKLGLSPLTWNDTLAQVGTAHCQDMIDKNYFAHNSPDGKGPPDRATAAGYQWTRIGENIAAGYTTAAEVMKGWMNSPDHKENILRPQFRELGVGLRQAADKRIYWAQEFGTP